MDRVKINPGQAKKQIESIEKEDAEDVAGYGSPTSGFYDANKKGYKSFGTIGQGDEKRGVFIGNDTKCAPRKIVVTVTAVATNETKNTTNNNLISLIEKEGTIDLNFLAEQTVGDDQNPMM